MITFGGQIIIGLVGIGFGASLAAIGWLVKRSIKQGEDLSTLKVQTDVVRQQVNPQNGPSLREILYGIQVQIGSVPPNPPPSPHP